jgi:RNA polymerase sigma factor (sigma-70 family)
MADDEDALIGRAKAGDRDAQDDLFRRHLPGLLAWVRLKSPDFLKDRESSLDVVQSVFRDVLGDLDGFEYRGPNSFRNWLLTYADNKLRNRVQFHQAARRAPYREVDASLSDLYGSICSPSRAMAAKEQVAEFERAFVQLSTAEQQIILLSRIEELTHAQIAERLGTTEAASKKALSRAMIRLAVRMARNQ